MKKRLLAAIMATAIALAVLALCGCGHQKPYSPCESAGLWGSPCGPELPVNW